MCSWVDPSHLSGMSESLGYWMPRMSPEATPLHLVIQIFFWTVLDSIPAMDQPPSTCDHHECDPDQLGMCTWVDPSHLSGMSESLGYGLLMSPEVTTPLYLLEVITFLCPSQKKKGYVFLRPPHYTCQSYSESLGYWMPRIMNPEATPLWV